MTLRRLVRLAAAATVVWSLAGVAGLARLAATLSGRPVLERGAIASDEWRDALARSGRPATRAAYNEARRAGSLAGERSAVAGAWTWVARTAEALPPDARVFLDVPDPAIYFYGTTLWYPRPLAASLSPATVVDGTSLRGGVVPLDAAGIARLRSAGFTHVVAMTEDGLACLDLRAFGERGR